MKEITIEYKYTLDEATLASVEVTYSVMKPVRTLPWWGWWSFVLFVMSIILKVPCLYVSPFLLFWALCAGMPLWIRLSARRQARKLPSLDNMIKWIVSESELKTSTEGAESRFTWDKLIMVHERPKGFLLFPQPRIAHWIPKHGFQSEDDIVLFRQIAKTKVLLRS